MRISPDGARLYVGTNGPAGGKLVVLGAPADDRSSGRARWRRKKPALSGAGGVTVTGLDYVFSRDNPLYEKLEASRRTEAIARARALGLLP